MSYMYEYELGKAADMLVRDSFKLKRRKFSSLPRIRRAIVG